MVPDTDSLSAFSVYNNAQPSSSNNRNNESRESRIQRRRKQRKLRRQEKRLARQNQDTQEGEASSSNADAKKNAKTAPKGKASSGAAKVTVEQLESPKDTAAEKMSKKVGGKKAKIEGEPSPKGQKSILKKDVKKLSTNARSFSSLNDSLDMASTSSFRKIPSSTPAKPSAADSQSSREGDDDEDDDDDQEEDDVMASVDSYKAELDASNQALGKRKWKQASKIRKVKKQAVEAVGSEAMGKSALARLIAPMDVDAFMSMYWERQHLHIPSKNTKKFSHLLSTELMDKALRNETLCYGRDLDVTTYSDGERQSHNVEGSRAQAHVVWDFYANGCSIRLLHPHTHSKNLLTVMSALQEYFGCLVGANSYLTPPSSQGFAPHYDDIEAFILQVEGKKRWRVYKPRSKHEVLPRFSSPNFSESDLTEPPVFDAVLSPGDLLYFPRGYIHQAHTLHKEHSLHVTISMYQKTSWFDLMEKLVPNAVKTAAANDLEFRRGLPIGYLRHAGVFTKYAPGDKKALVQTAKHLMSKLVNFMDIDSAVDELGVQFMHDALPPVLTPAEAACSVIGNGWRMEPNGKLRNKIEFPLTTRVRLTRAYCYRLVQEDVVDQDGQAFTQVSLYYTVDNSKMFHGEEPNFLVVEPDLLVTVRALVNAYPQFTTMKDLPCSSEDKMYGLICDLWDHGLLVTETPPEPIGDQTTIMTEERDSSANESTAESTAASEEPEEESEEPEKEPEEESEEPEEEPEEYEEEPEAPVREPEPPVRQNGHRPIPHRPIAFRRRANYGEEDEAFGSSDRIDLDDVADEDLPMDLTTDDDSVSDVSDSEILGLALELGIDPNHIGGPEISPDEGYVGRGR